jgi:hypothetical protein
MARQFLLKIVQADGKKRQKFQVLGWVGEEVGLIYRQAIHLRELKSKEEQSVEF